MSTSTSNRLTRLLGVITLAAGLTACGFTAPSHNPGFVSFDGPGHRGLKHDTTVSLGPRVLRFAANHTDEDPETQALLRSIDGALEGSFHETVSVCSGASGDLLWKIDDDPKLLHDLTSAAIGDVNGDGIPDVAAGFHWPTGAQPMKGWVQVHSGKDGAELFRVSRADLE